MPHIPINEISNKSLSGTQEMREKAMEEAKVVLFQTFNPIFSTLVKDEQQKIEKKNDIQKEHKNPEIIII